MLNWPILSLIFQAVKHIPGTIPEWASFDYWIVYATISMRSGRLACAFLDAWNKGCVIIEKECQKNLWKQKTKYG